MNHILVPNFQRLFILKKQINFDEKSAMTQVAHARRFEFHFCAL